MIKHILTACLVGALLQSCHDGMVSLNLDEGLLAVVGRSQFVYSDAGCIHNQGLAIVGQSECDWKEMTNSGGLDSLNSIVTPFVCAAIDSVDEDMDIWMIALEDHTLSGFMDKYHELDSIRSGTSDLNESEEEYLDRLASLFSVDYSGLTDAQVGKILEDSLTVYTTMLMLYPVRYELRAGAYLGASSAEFWQNWDGDTEGELEKFVQLDLGGYLIGWINAWIDDQGPNYSTSWEAQKKRIAKGVRAGVGASCLRMINIGGSW